jgi:hypothetical protein
MSFTAEMKEHIKKFGWNPKRQIDLFDDFMLKYNYPDFIISFLQRFGDLKIHKLQDTNSGIINTTIINPFKSDGMDADSVSYEYSSDLNQKLYVIGVYLPENFEIAVDVNGAVYLLGEYCWCMGKDIFQGIESIVRVDQWSSLELNPKNTASGIWYDIHGKMIDFEEYVFDYRTF